VGEAIARIFTPENPGSLVAPMITLLGGSCGGYISFSGAHRLLDAGYGGEADVPHFRKSVLTGIAVSGTVRILLFLAVLGTCGLAAENAASIIAASNPAAETFRLAAGDLGYRLFGLALFCAGTTSVVGAAYTSVSFLKTLHPFIMKNERWFIVGFIAFSTLVMTLVGSPAKVLVVVGALNGLILPISLGIILIASRNKKIVGEHYNHPVWLIALGVIVVAVAAYLGITTFVSNLSSLVG
jgi:Mn2+/Fe2+ NRAMP family transporter